MITLLVTLFVGALAAGIASAVLAQSPPPAERLRTPNPCDVPHPVALPDQPFELVLGGRLAGPFILSEEAIQARVAVLGASGSGKSRFLFLLFASLMVARRGFLLIDPHGDLAHALLAYAKSRIDKGDRALLGRLHFLEPSRSRFTLDPFASMPHGLPRDRYEARLKARVDRVRRNLMRRVAEADQDVMLRLKRWMTNIITACGVRDAEGRHIGLHEALVFTNPQHPTFESLYARVAAFLPDETREDFEKLRETKRPLDQEKWLESSINRFRDILSPITKRMFAPRTGDESLHVGDLIRRGAFVIASLQETAEFSHDEKQGIGGLLIDEVLTAKQAEEDEVIEEKRVPFVLGIDEFSEFIGEDLLRCFGAVRKYRLSIIVASQDLSTLEKGQLDLAARVLSQCHTKLVFNMTWPDDLEVLARNLGYGNIDFTELVHEVDRHGGYDFIPVVEPSVSFQTSTSSGKGGARATARGGSESDSRTLSEQETWAHALGKNRSVADGDSRSENSTVNSGQSRGETLDIVDGFLRNRFPTLSLNDARSQGSGRAITSQVSDGESETSTEGGGRGVAVAHAEGKNWNVTDTENWTDSESQGRGLTLAHKLMTLARIIREQQRTGQLEMSVADQFERLMQQIHGLQPRWCLVKVPGEKMAFLAEVALTREPYETPTAKLKALRAIKEQLLELRPYYAPESDEEEARPASAPAPSESGNVEENPIA
jgi:hypothetical protein